MPRKKKTGSRGESPEKNMDWNTSGTVQPVTTLTETEARSAGNPASDSAGSDPDHLDKNDQKFQHLQEMFKDKIDAEVVYMILSECDWEVDQALETLLPLIPDNNISQESKTRVQLRLPGPGVNSNMYPGSSQSSPSPSTESSPSPRLKTFPTEEQVRTATQPKLHVACNLGRQSRIPQFQEQGPSGPTTTLPVLSPRTPFIAAPDFFNSGPGQEMEEENVETAMAALGSYASRLNDESLGEYELSPSSDNGMFNLPLGNQRNQSLGSANVDWCNSGKDSIINHNRDISGGSRFRFAGPPVGQDGPSLIQGYAGHANPSQVSALSQNQTCPQGNFSKAQTELLWPDQFGFHDTSTSPLSKTPTSQATNTVAETKLSARQKAEPAMPLGGSNIKTNTDSLLKKHIEPASMRHPMQFLRRQNISLDPYEAESLEKLVEEVIHTGVGENLNLYDSSDESDDETGQQDPTSKSSVTSPTQSKQQPPHLKVAAKHMKNLPPRFRRKLHDDVEPGNGQEKSNLEQSQQSEGNQEFNDSPEQMAESPKVENLSPSMKNSDSKTPAASLEQKQAVAAASEGSFPDAPKTQQAVTVPDAIAQMREEFQRNEFSVNAPEFVPRGFTPINSPQPSSSPIPVVPTADQSTPVSMVTSQPYGQLKQVFRMSPLGRLSPQPGKHLQPTAIDPVTGGRSSPLAPHFIVPKAPHPMTLQPAMIPIHPYHGYPPYTMRHLPFPGPFPHPRAGFPVWPRVDKLNRGKIPQSMVGHHWLVTPGKNHPRPYPGAASPAEAIHAQHLISASGRPNSAPTVGPTNARMAANLQLQTVGVGEIPKSETLVQDQQMKEKISKIIQEGKKVMVILRGCPGSGKSYLARELVLDGVILSTDDFFIKDGKYEHDFSKIGDAHEWNKKRAKTAVAEGKNPIVIDNTNTQSWEMKFYVKLAVENGYHVSIVEPSTTWKFKASDLARKTKHGVPEEHIQRMIDRYEHHVTTESILDSSEKHIEGEKKLDGSTEVKPARKRKRRRRRKKKKTPSTEETKDVGSEDDILKHKSNQKEDTSDDDSSQTEEEFSPNVNKPAAAKQLEETAAEKPQADVSCASQHLPDVLTPERDLSERGQLLNIKSLTDKGHIADGESDQRSCENGKIEEPGGATESADVGEQVLSPEGDVQQVAPPNSKKQMEDIEHQEEIVEMTASENMGQDRSVTEVPAAGCAVIGSSDTSGACDLTHSIKSEHRQNHTSAEKAITEQEPTEPASELNVLRTSNLDDFSSNLIVQVTDENKNNLMGDQSQSEKLGSDFTAVSQNLQADLSQSFVHVNQTLITDSAFDFVKTEESSFGQALEAGVSKYAVETLNENSKTKEMVQITENQNTVQSVTSDDSDVISPKSESVMGSVDTAAKLSKRESDKPNESIKARIEQFIREQIFEGIVNEEVAEITRKADRQASLEYNSATPSETNTDLNLAPASAQFRDLKEEFESAQLIELDKDSDCGSGLLLDLDKEFEEFQDSRSGQLLDLDKEFEEFQEKIATESAEKAYWASQRDDPYLVKLSKPAPDGTTLPQVPASWIEQKDPERTENQIQASEAVTKDTKPSLTEITHGGPFTSGAMESDSDKSRTHRELEWSPSQDSLESWSPTSPTSPSGKQPKPRRSSNRRRVAANFMDPALDQSVKEDLLNKNWVLPQYPGALKQEDLIRGDNKTKFLLSCPQQTYTDPADLAAIQRISDGDGADSWLSRFHSVLNCRSRGINESSTSGALSLDKKNEISATACPAKTLVDKSCATEELDNKAETQEGVLLLQNCFPEVSEDDLGEILERCNQDLQWAVNLLLDAGYEYNDPTTKRVHSTTSTNDDVSSLAPVAGKEVGATAVKTSHIEPRSPVSLMEICHKSIAQKSKDLLNSEDTQEAVLRGSVRRLESIEEFHQVHSPLETKFSEKDADPFVDRQLSRESNQGRNIADKSSECSLEQLKLSYSDTEQGAESPGQMLQSEELDKTVFSVESQLESQKGAVAMETVKDKDPEAADSLLLSLSPQMARQLQKMFGPVGFHVSPDSMSSEDLTIRLNRKAARDLHRCWAMTLREKFALEEAAINKMKTDDEALARRLQAEEDYGYMMKLSRDQSKDGDSSVKLSQGQIKPAERATNTRAAPRRPALVGIAGGDASGDVSLSSTRRSESPVFLKDIMAEEQVMETSRREYLESRGLTQDHDALSTKMKRQKLYDEFASVDPTLLEEFFEANGYELEKTQKAIQDAIGSTHGLPESVMTSEAAQKYEEYMIKQATEESLKDMWLGAADETTDGEADDLYQTLEDPAYNDFRAEASMHYRLRHECFQKAQEAFQRGMKAVASFYSQQGHLHTQKLREANRRAAGKIVQHRNLDLDKNNCLDLHGLHVDEALEELQKALALRVEDLQKKPDKRKCHLCVVTGRGSHSRGGVARIRPAVIDFLHRNKYRYTEPQAGLVKVLL